jgi:hypothetical protein
VAPLSVEQHVLRADGHEALGVTLHEVGHEWAAVAYFYAAYHLVSGALLSDPIFADPGRLASANAHLTMADRDVTKHKGYMKFGPGASRTKVWGLSDLVALLYRSINPFYSQLHEASVDVRYGTGLRVPLDKLAAAQKLIKDEYAAGTLLAP